jgi:F0F1-type ATP synthase membrane subunit a
MAAGTIILLVFGVITLTLLIIVFGFIFLIKKTINDVKEIIRNVMGVSVNIKEKKYSEVMKNEMVREQVLNLLTIRFWIFAPIAKFFLKKILFK